MPDSASWQPIVLRRPWCSRADPGVQMRKIEKSTTPSVSSFPLGDFQPTKSCSQPYSRSPAARTAECGIRRHPLHTRFVRGPGRRGCNGSDRSPDSATDQAAAQRPRHGTKEDGSDRTYRNLRGWQRGEMRRINNEMLVERSASLPAGLLRVMVLTSDDTRWSVISFFEARNRPERPKLVSRRSATRSRRACVGSVSASSPTTSPSTSRWSPCSLRPARGGRCGRPTEGGARSRAVAQGTLAVRSGVSRTGG